MSVITSIHACMLHNKNRPGWGYKYTPPSMQHLQKKKSTYKQPLLALLSFSPYAFFSLSEPVCILSNSLTSLACCSCSSFLSPSLLLTLVCQLVFRYAKTTSFGWQPSVCDIEGRDMNSPEFKDCFDIASACPLLFPWMIIKALECASGPKNRTKEKNK
jgi:hypothetical protein